MNLFHPEPPFLSIGAYSVLPDVEVLHRIDAMIMNRAATRTAVEVVDATLPFKTRDELIGYTQVVRADSRNDVDVIKSGHRVVRAAYHLRAVGRIVVSYLDSPSVDRHPVDISVSAGPLGIPMHNWSAKEVTAATRLARWTKALAKEVMCGGEAVYGSVGVEISLPVPMDISASSFGLGTEVFVSNLLLSDSPSLGGKLRSMLVDGALEDWSCGVFLSGWAPFNELGVTVDDVSGTAAGIASLVANALKQHLSG